MKTITKSIRAGLRATRKFLMPAVLALAVSVTLDARADNNWTGAAGDGLWTTAVNWSLGVVPATGQGNMSINNQTFGSTVSLNSAATFDGDIFGPEWGMTLNIDGGSLAQSGFVFAPVGDTANPSVINVVNGASFSVVNLLLGDNWWFWTAPAIHLNVYDTSTVTTSDWMWLGGRLNLYGGTLDIAGNINMDSHGQGYAQIDIEQGTLIVRGDDITANVADWQSAGQLTAYGGAGTIFFNFDGTDSYVTAVAPVPEPSAAALLLLGVSIFLRGRQIRR